MNKRFFMLLVLAVVTLLALCSTAMAESQYEVPVTIEEYATDKLNPAIIICQDPACQGKSIQLTFRSKAKTCLFAHTADNGDIHKWSFDHTIQSEWKCTDICQYCGCPSTELTAWIGTLKHNYDGEADGTDPATCMSPERVYDECGYGCHGWNILYTVGDKNPDAHVGYMWTPNTDATCTTPGTEKSPCVFGHDGYAIRVDETKPALSHIPGPAADCTTPQVCARGCGYVYKPATGHNYKGMTNLKYTNLGANHDVDGICPNCGEEIGYIEAHIYYTQVDGVKKCACGAIDPDYVTPIPDGLNPDDGWVYEGGVRSDFTGLYPYDGALFYILNGQWQRGANGLTLIIDEFWFLANGQVQEHHGFALYDGEWFYLDGEGKLDVTASGVYNYDGKTFLVAAGRLVSEYSGLAQVPSGEWYYVAEGRVLTEFSGEIEWNGATFQIVNGKLVA